MDDVDVYGTFTHNEARNLGMTPAPPVKGGAKPGGEGIYEKVPGRQNSSAYVSG